MHADGGGKRPSRGTDAEPNEPAAASGRPADRDPVDIEAVAGRARFGPDGGTP